MKAMMGLFTQFSEHRLDLSVLWFAVLAFVVGFLVAQVWKTVAGLLKRPRGSERMTFGEAVAYFSRSGGMPSGHSASFTALTVYLGNVYGFDSGVFILALGCLAIVLYDATHVRYAVGLQGEALNRILEKNGEKPLLLVEGHTILQVVVGVLIGICVGILVSSCLRLPV